MLYQDGATGPCAPSRATRALSHIVTCERTCTLHCFCYLPPVTMLVGRGITASHVCFHTGHFFCTYTNLGDSETDIVSGCGTLGLLKLSEGALWHLLGPCGPLL